MKERYQGPGTVKVIKDNMRFKLQFDELELELEEKKDEKAPTYKQLVKNTDGKV